MIKRPLRVLVYSSLGCDAVCDRAKEPNCAHNLCVYAADVGIGPSVDCCVLYLAQGCGCKKQTEILVPNLHSTAASLDSEPVPL